MIELLILAILLDGENTIYKIRQKLQNIFFLFISSSFGSVHPALKKLEKNELISVKRKMTEGGKKSCLYSLTNKGKKYFDELMTSAITEPVTYSNQIANIKIMLLDRLNENLRKYAIESVKKYYEIKLLNTKDLLGTLEKTQGREKEKHLFKIILLKHQIDKISREINWIEDI
jgi:DNA-binding PadR family transcriptional regulator